MTQRSRSASSWTAAAWLAAAVLAVAAVSFTAAAAPEKEDKEDKAEETKKQSAAKKPRVFTNADLEKYGQRAGGGSAKVVARSTAPWVPAEVKVSQPRTSLPPEDRLDGASLPELEDRRGELQTLLEYLKAKAAWFRNPFLPRPTALPPGEVLLDEQLSGAEELRLTQTRLFAVQGRLGKIRLLIQSGGGGAQALQP